MQHLKIQTLLLISFLIIGQNIHAQKPTKTAKRYFSKVADIIKNNYYFIDSVNFNEIEFKAKQYLSQSTNASQTYPAIDSILYNLFDKHSNLMRPKTNQSIDSLFPLKYPAGRLLNNNVGYIKIPYILGHYDSTQIWVDSLRSIYEKYNDTNTKGWIIDLRGNFGGNIHPMLTGLYPFFGDTIVLTFVQRNGENEGYRFANGFLIGTVENKMVKQLMSYKKLKIGSDNKKLAVIIDNKVASSGEILAIALSNRDNTKLFGTETAGIPTIVRNWQLSDGAFLGIVTGAFLDKHNNPYIRSIKPNVQVDNINSNEAIDKAIEWINEK